MIGLVEVSQDTLFLLFVTERQFHKSYRPKLAFSVIGFLNMTNRKRNYAKPNHHFQF